MRFFRLGAVVALLLSPAVFAQGTMKMRQIAIIDLPGKPGYDAVAFANGMLLMSHTSANTVDIFDPARRRLVAQVQGVSGPRSIAVDTQGQLAYIAGQTNNSITVLNTKDWSVKGVIGLKHAPENLLFVPGTQSLLVSNPNNRSVSVVSTESIGKKEAELAVIDVQGKPQQMVWDPAKRVAYLAIEDRSEIAVLNPENPSAAVVKRFAVNASQPTGVVLDPDTRKLYVAVRYAVLQLEADTGNEISRAAAAAGTDTLWLDTASKALYAAAGDGSVNIYRVSGNIVTENEFRAEVRGHAIAFDPTTKMMYLGGGREGKAKVLILKEANLAPAGEAQTAENR
jgi:DNA-binding beta-propeller fold protein YncE